MLWVCVCVGGGGGGGILSFSRRTFPDYNIREALPGVLGTGETGHLFQGNRGTKAKF